MFLSLCLKLMYMFMYLAYKHLAYVLKLVFMLLLKAIIISLALSREPLSFIYKLKTLSFI